MSILHKRPGKIAAAPQPSHVISITSSAGTLCSGPTVAMSIQLPEAGLLTLNMRHDEAYALARELLAAIDMARRSHQRAFGPNQF